MSLGKQQTDLAAIACRLERDGSVVLLESQSYAHPEGKRSYLAARPTGELTVRGKRIVRRTYTGEGYHEEWWEGDPWEAVKSFRDATDGWLFGYLGYDLKNHLERLTSANPDPVGAPDLYFMNPGLIVECGPAECSVVKGSLPREDTARDGPAVPASYSLTRFGPRLSERRYRATIRRAKQQIYEGEYYEINLSHQMEGAFEGDPLALYRAMRRAGPVPFGAYLSFGRWRVCCASPERFLANRDGRVYSQPIKGTVRRGTDAEEDERLARWLRHSDKNRAENLMIVDLVRNDLGRIARKGTVRTTGLFEIQSFGTVHQMVSTVEALAGDHHPVDIIKACFPMGSMTGAPKIRSMRAIEDLEEYRRGIYSGAAGYMRPDGNFDFNVVIRTAIITGGRLYYPVGGAITSDSEPAAEWQETLTKAKALTATRPGALIHPG